MMSWQAWCPPATWPANAPPVRWRELLVDPGHKVGLWLFTLDDPASDEKPLTECLQEDEHDRSKRFRQTLHARRHRVGRAMLRHLLGEQGRLSAAQLRWQIGHHGKPSLAPITATDLRFNLSHSAGWALLATSFTLELGVDLEELRSQGHLLDMGTRIESLREQRNAAPEQTASARADSLLRTWVRKEACLKAAGIGLNREMSTLTLRPEGLLDDDGEPPHLHALPAIGWIDVPLPEDCPAVASCAWLRPA